MRICHLDPLFHPYYGGSEKVVYEVSKRLVANQGHDVTVLTSRLPNTVPSETLDGIKIVRVSPSIYLEKMPALFPPPYTIVPFFNCAFVKQDADIFHMHNRFWYFYGTMLTLAMRKSLQGKKFAITLHNALPKGVSFGVDKGALAYDLLVGRRWMELANVIIAVSEYTRDVTVPKSLQHKVHVAHNGVDVTRFDVRKRGKKGEDGAGALVRKKLGIDADAFVVLENARMVEQKGYPYLLEAFAMLKKKRKNAELVCIGKGPLKQQLLDLAAKLGISKSVHFVTGIPEDELPLYYRAADLFAHSAVWEPCAVVHPEALASGLPIVAARIGGNPEQIGEDCGLLVEPRDAKAMFEAIDGLYADENERRRMGANARERAVKKFAWEVVAGKWDKAYESVA
ncbi:MAG: glycosyltransferase family 4 protein [Candidatus Burarchaeum sp.]|nr:glycosyltransferase family 4 protein [Candidatus Burarchaeum sp.]MDO8339633.1 glycosyltransferase family 4 protein [Candidatus Burarchaeum sp.]